MHERRAGGKGLVCMCGCVCVGVCVCVCVCEREKERKGEKECVWGMAQSQYDQLCRN